MSNSKWDKAFPAGAKAGLQGERKRVIAYLERRAEELNECHKQDSCKELYFYTIGLIEDINEGEH